MAFFMKKNHIIDKIGAFLWSLKTMVYHFIAPAMCSYCTVFLSEREVLCGECAARICPVVSHELAITKRHSIKIYAKGLYKDPLKKLIVAKRWKCIASSKQLAHIVLSIPTIAIDDYDYIIPIPLHWKRHALRGFNQAYEMALEIRKEKNIEVADILKRAKSTQFQSELTHEQRIDNLKNAFELISKNPTMFYNKKLLIIDDVMTTGTTIKAAAKILLSLRPQSIAAVVACRA